MADIIIVLVAVLIVTYGIYYRIKTKRESKGKGGCASCSSASLCTKTNSCDSK